MDDRTEGVRRMRTVNSLQNPRGTPARRLDLYSQRDVMVGIVSRRRARSSRERQ